MIANILKRVWYLIVAISTVGGVIGFYQQFTAGDDYAMTLYVKSSEKIIENASRMSDLRVYFNGKETRSLYITKLALKNTGKRAIGREYVYEPVTVASITPAKFLRADCDNNMQSIVGESLVLKWELINPAESIDCSVFSTDPLDLKVSSRIREVGNVALINEIANPPTGQRLRQLSMWWFFLITISVMAFCDAVLLVKADVKGARVLGLIKSLSNEESVSKEAFLGELRVLYEDYYKSARLFVTPDELVRHISSQLPPGDLITGKYLEIARTAAIECEMHGNMYNIRAYGVIFWPAIFIVCVIRVAVYLLF